MNNTYDKMTREEADHRDILVTIKDMGQTQAATLQEIKEIRDDFKEIITESRKEAEDRETRHREDIANLNQRIDGVEKVISDAKEERNKQVRDIEISIEQRVPKGEQSFTILKWAGGVGGIVIIGALLRQIIIT